MVPELLTHKEILLFMENVCRKHEERGNVEKTGGVSPARVAVL